tara:strand:- start:207 stop:413 length:207 start_codon:yes stop_codon:yes gene_type:complete
MLTSVLDDTTRKRILFDVLDGIPASKDESLEESRFRNEIEHDDDSLKCRANELGVQDPLIEFSSSGSI